MANSSPQIPILIRVAAAAILLVLLPACASVKTVAKMPKIPSIGQPDRPDLVALENWYLVSEEPPRLFPSELPRESPTTFEYGEWREIKGTGVRFFLPNSLPPERQAQLRADVLEYEDPGSYEKELAKMRKQSPAPSDGTALDETLGEAGDPGNTAVVGRSNESLLRRMVPFL